MKTSIQISHKEWDLNAPLTVGVMFKMWEEVFFPTLLQTFATKEEFHELKEEVTNIDEKFSKKTDALENKFDRLERKVDMLTVSMNERFDEVGVQIKEVRGEQERANKRFGQHSEKQKKTEELYLQHIRRLNTKVFPHVADKNVVEKQQGQVSGDK